VKCRQVSGRQSSSRSHRQMFELAEEEIQNLYVWIDQIPLSKPKRNFTRDFADGVACAEVVRHFIPRIVDLHNYSNANSISQKLYNWNTLNQKVFKRINYQTSEGIMSLTGRCD
jgi:CH-like domain in sperm protein